MSYPAPPTQPIAEPKNGFGITALVLAIVAIPFGFIPLTGFVALILGVLAVLFAFLGWGRARKGRATNKKMNYFAGIIGVVAIALGVWGLSIVYNATEEFVNEMNETTEQFEQDMRELDKQLNQGMTTPPSTEPPEPTTEAPTPEAVEPPDFSVEPVAPPTYEPAPTYEPEPTPMPQVPVEVQNATATARSYVEMSGFSEESLIKQLEFEGYPTDVATQAVESLGVDWKSEAVESAQSYMDMTSFSRSGLIGQLKFEGFTQEQAEYAANQIF